MENEFIPYEEALALKELGSGEGLCYGFYNEMDNNKPQPGVADGALNGAPLYQQAFRWFREKHKWSSYIKSIEYIGHNGVKQVWEVNLKYLPTNSEHKGMVYETYEEAELACLRKLIKRVKTFID